MSVPPRKYGDITYNQANTISFHVLSNSLLIPHEAKRLEVIVLHRRNLMVGFSPRISGFTPSAVHASFAVERMDCSSRTSDFPRQLSFHRYSTFIHVLSAEWTMGPLEVVFPGHISTTVEN